MYRASDRFFKKDTSIGPTGLSAATLYSSQNHTKGPCFKEVNFVPGLQENQSASRSELEGFIQN